MFPLKRQFTAIGDTVNVASRACGQANAWQVVVTAACAGELEERARARVELCDLGTVELKGKGDVQLYRVEGADLEQFFSGGDAALRVA